MQEPLSTLIDNFKWLTGYLAIMMIGNSGSGKSTVATALSKRLAVPIVCPDEIRTRLTGDELVQSANKEVWEIAYREAAGHLITDQKVIVDATNANQNDRRRLIAFIREQNPNISAIIGIWMDTSLMTCLLRNNMRTVPRPEMVIRKMHAQIRAYHFEGKTLISTEPSLMDGFTHLIRVDGDTLKIK